MKVTNNADGTTIEFGNKLNGKVKMIFIFSATIAALVMLRISMAIYSIITQPDSSVVLLGFLSAALIIACIVLVRYFKRAYRKETLLITKNTLTISSILVGTTQKTDFNIDGITALRYNGKSAKTDHPLKGNSFDYLGFETRELVISEMHNEGNLSFNYEGHIVSFGREVYSWDAEKISNILSDVTGGRLHIGNLPTEDNEEDILPTEQPA